MILLFVGRKCKYSFCLKLCFKVVNCIFHFPYKQRGQDFVSNKTGLVQLYKENLLHVSGVHKLNQQIKICMVTRTFCLGSSIFMRLLG